MYTRKTFAPTTILELLTPHAIAIKFVLAPYEHGAVNRCAAAVTLFQMARCACVRKQSVLTGGRPSIY